MLFPTVYKMHCITSKAVRGDINLKRLYTRRPHCEAVNRSIRYSNANNSVATPILTRTLKCKYHYVTFVVIKIYKTQVQVNLRAVKFSSNKQKLSLIFYY